MESLHSQGPVDRLLFSDNCSFILKKAPVVITDSVKIIRLAIITLPIYPILFGNIMDIHLKKIYCITCPIITRKIKMAFVKSTQSSLLLTLIIS